ncbi:MAG: T9SS C-terminal target domain-containing protein [Chitinophagia bacterium]|nr:T9SS C-terminal target domain-containing protein [Chitinophagia bacterium]
MNTHGNVGVQNVGSGKANLLIMPNPNSGSFTIKGSFGNTGDEDATIEITDMLGQVVYTEKVKADKGELNQSVKLSGTLANGMYLVNIKSATVNQVFHFVLEQ